MAWLATPSAYLMLFISANTLQNKVLEGVVGYSVRILTVELLTKSFLYGVLS